MGNANTPSSLSRANSSAMRYANEVAAEIINNGLFAELRHRMVRLLTEEYKTSTDIALELSGDMHLRPGVTIQTAASIVRRVLHALVDDTERREAHAVLHAKSLERHQEATGAKRDEWMRENGLFVWSPEQNEYFMRIIGWRRMKRGDGDICNHEKIAAAMNRHFDCEDFTPDLCRRHLEALRKQGHVSQSTVRRTRRSDRKRNMKEDAAA